MTPGTTTPARRPHLLIAAAVLLALVAGVLAGTLAAPSLWPGAAGDSDTLDGLPIVDTRPIGHREIIAQHIAYLNLQIWAESLYQAATANPERFYRYLAANPQHGCAGEHWPASTPSATGDGPARQPSLLDIEAMFQCAAQRLGPEPEPADGEITASLLSSRADTLWRANDPARLLEVRVAREGYSARAEENASMSQAAGIYAHCAAVPERDRFLATPTGSPALLAESWLALQEAHKRCAGQATDQRFPAKDAGAPSEP